MEKSRILTERLLVRIPEKEDINDIFLMMSDEHTAINTGFRPMSNPSEAEGKIRRGIENHNMFVIALKETPSNAIGMIELLKTVDIRSPKTGISVHYSYSLLMAMQIY